ATTIWAQADLLDLYDPDRVTTFANGDSASTWEVFLDRLSRLLATLQANGGAGLRILTQTVTSPTLALQLQAIIQKFPNARWHQWDPLTRDSLREARAQQVFGAEVLYDFRKARVVVALDSDFLVMHPAALRHARD